MLVDLDLDDNNSSVDSFVTQIASETKQSSSIPSSQGVNKDERKAELERRREERRQVERHHILRPILSMLTLHI